MLPSAGQPTPVQPPTVVPNAGMPEIASVDPYANSYPAPPRDPYPSARHVDPLTREAPFDPSSVPLPVGNPMFAPPPYQPLPPPASLRRTPPVEEDVRRVDYQQTYPRWPR
jgi:hypothetical protein